MKNFLVILILFTSLNCFAQSYGIEVKYQQAILDKSLTKSDSAKIFKDIEYRLRCTTNASEFMLIDKLSSSQKSNLLYVAKAGANGLFYKNLTSKENLRLVDFLGESILIKKKFFDHTWSLKKEEKKIGQYLCKKAVSKYTFKLPTGKMLSYNIEAWYTEEIPVPFGPRGFDGLPGLVLQVKWNKYSLIASSVSVKKAEKFKLERPKGYKEMTQQEFKSFVDDLYNKKE